MQKLPNKPSPNVDVLRVFFFLKSVLCLGLQSLLFTYPKTFFPFFFLLVLIMVKDMGRTSKDSRVSIIKVLFISLVHLILGPSLTSLQN